TKTTDDSGDYRFFWLPPADYYVGVTPPRPSVTDGRPQAYAKTFYPSVTDARAAERISLRDGTDLKGMNISVPVVNSVKVTGQVVDSIPGAAQSATSSLFFFLMSRDASTLTDTTLQLSNERASRSAQFELRGVPAGSYDLITSAPDNQGRS